MARLSECPIHIDSTGNVYRRCLHLGQRYLTESKSPKHRHVWISYNEVDDRGRVVAGGGGVLFYPVPEAVDWLWDRCVEAMRADVPPSAIPFYNDILGECNFSPAPVPD